MMVRSLGQHLALAHRAWRNHLRPGDRAIDATCGNGRDLLVLATLLAPEANEQSCESVQISAYDIQKAAIEKARCRIAQSSTPQLLNRIEWICDCHSRIGSRKQEHGSALIVYNLGYLPGGEREITTRVETTLLSLTRAAGILSPRGAISIMCYPGHEEGRRELQAVRSWSSQKPKRYWKTMEQCQADNPIAPTWFWLKRLHPSIV